MYWILTAATKLFSVMKVTHSRGSVSELRLVTLWSQYKCQSAHPQHTHKRTHRYAAPPSLLRAGLASLCNRHGGVMGSPGQAVAGVWEAHAVHPATASTCSLTYSSRPSGLKQHLPERHLAAPGSGAGLLLHLLNVGWEHPVGEGERGPDVDKTQGREKEAIYSTTIYHLFCAVFMLYLCALVLCIFMKIS